MPMSIPRRLENLRPHRYNYDGHARARRLRAADGAFRRPIPDCGRGREGEGGGGRKDTLVSTRKVNRDFFAFAVCPASANNNSNYNSGKSPGLGEKSWQRKRVGRGKAEWRRLIVVPCRQACGRAGPESMPGADRHNSPGGGRSPPTSQSCSSFFSFFPDGINYCDFLLRRFRISHL